jgi:hypothetical protein
MKFNKIKSELIKDTLNSIDTTSEYFRNFGYAHSLRLNVLRQIEYDVSFYTKAIPTDGASSKVDAEYKTNFIITDYKPSDDLVSTFTVIIVLSFKEFRSKVKKRVNSATLNFIFPSKPDVSDMIGEIKNKLPSILN